MPPIERSGRHQKAVLWRKVGQTDDNVPIVSAADEIDVRWNDRRTETVASDGTPLVLDATVVIGLEDVPDGSILWKGNLENFTNGAITTELFRVVTARYTPDVKARNTRRVLGLQRYGKTLPTIA